jgi:hypothetical protein
MSSARSEGMALEVIGAGFGRTREAFSQLRES